MKKKYLIGLAGILLIVGGYFFLSHPNKARNTSNIKGGPEAAATPAVEIPLEKQRMIGIKTAEVSMKPLKRTIRTVGRIEFDERKLTTVNVKVEGYIDKLYADYSGKYVKKGTPLAEIYSPELIAVQLEYLNILRWKTEQVTRTQIQRVIEFNWSDRYGTTGKGTVEAPDLDSVIQIAQDKFSLWEISKSQVKKLEQTKKPFRTFTVRSPSSGYVFQKPVFKGTRVAPGDKIFDIVDLSTVWVMADVYEYEIPFIKAGQKARITLSGYPEKEFFSEVDFVYPTLSGQTRTAKARFVVPNPDGFLKPQMFANVEMEIDYGERLVIPATAVLDTGTRRIVYLDEGDGFFSARQINTGIRTDIMVEVLSGIKPGEKVAVSSVFLIDSEAKLKGISR